MGRRILSDPLLWCLLLLLTLLFGMPHMTRFFAALFPALDRPVYRQESFAALAFAHLWLVLTSSVIAVIIGVGAGIGVTRPTGRAFRPLLETVAAVGQTFPPVAMLAVAVMGFSAEPATIALVLYGLLPIVQATITGLETVPASLHEIATGAGMNRGQILRRVELPLAAPVIISGIRTSVIINIGTAAIASTVGVKSLGSPIIIGLSGFNIAYVLQGALLVALLAIISDMLFERWMLAMDDNDIARQHDAADGAEREQGNHAENGGLDKLHGHPYMHVIRHYKYSPRRYKVDATTPSLPGLNDEGGDTTFPGRKQRSGRLPLTRRAG